MVSASSEPREPKGRRVIVVEDDDDTREVLSIVLSSAGYRVDEAATGESAMGLMLGMTEPPDLAVVDVVMPGISGYDVVRAMRQAPKLATVPVIIISGAPRPEGEDAEIDVGARLDKPSSVEELLDAAAHLVAPGDARQR